MKRCAGWSAALLTAIACNLAAQEDGVSVRRIGTERQQGVSYATLVSKDAALVHTTQLLPTTTGGADAQIKSLLDQLETLRADCSGKLAKVNVYVKDSETATEVLNAFAEAFASSAPAVSFVETPLPKAEAVAALDAVFAAKSEGDAPTRKRVDAVGGPQRHAHLAVLPPTGAVYIAGQAERSDQLKDATEKTMESLRKTLEHLELSKDDVVSVKSFLTPMTDAATVVEVMEEFFDGRPVPPLVFVEWQSTLPIEIEMVVADRKRPTPVVDYVTPPGMTASPIYSRVARASGHATLYVSGLYGNEEDPDQQVRDIFKTLTRVSNAAGTDLRHLLKATYYCSADDVSRSLNALRPDYYDPERPPAASKAIVAGTGREDRTLTIDMIAAVREGDQ